MGPNDRPAAATRWTWMAWSAAALAACLVSLAILRNPVQVTDALIPMLSVQNESPVMVFRTMVNEASGLSRPLYWLEVKLLLDASRGNYFVAYKTSHLVFVAALFILFVRAAGVRSRDETFAFLFALVVLTGMHPFLGMVWEGYPVNHYLEIAVFSLGALVLCQSRGGWTADVCAAMLFIVASLTLDSGLLVWVVIFTARLIGLRGVSWRGVAIMTGLLAVYMTLRFGVLGIGVPDVGERASGFGFSRIEPAEIERRFVATGHLYYFYVYNTVSALLSVFLSEPTSGQWLLTERLANGDVDPMVATNVISALVATGLIVWFALNRRAAWAARQFEHSDQLVIICAAVALGNAAMCFSYVKDEIMSTAGVFYALAVFGATREALARWGQARWNTVAITMLTVILFAGSTAWTIRATGLQYQVLLIGTADRYEWAHVDEWLAQQRRTPATLEGQRLVKDLRAEAMRTRPLSVLFVPRWVVRWFIPE
jgi:hypothetical protein